MAKFIEDGQILAEVTSVPQTREEVTNAVAATLNLDPSEGKVTNGVKNGLASLKKRGLVVSQRRRWMLASASGSAPVPTPAEEAPLPPAEEAPLPPAEEAPPAPVEEAPLPPAEVAAAPEAQEAFGLLTLSAEEVAQHEVYDLRCPDTLTALLAAQPCFSQGPVVGCEDCVLALHCGSAAEKRLVKERAAAKRAAAAEKRAEEKRVALLAELEAEASAAGIDLATVSLPPRKIEGSEVLTLISDARCPSTGILLPAGSRGVLVMGWGVVHPLILRAEVEGRWPTRILEAR
jgi:hypothetical protein